jgi:Stress responsive A/B Barrel Domain
MKTIAAGMILLMTFAACAPASQTAAAGSRAPLPAEGALRHVVVFKYRPGATQAQIQQVTEAFRALQEKIPGIVAFEQGVNNSPEEKNLGFTHVYTLTFESAAARDAYLPHPEHAAFGRLLGTLGVLEDAFVVDYHPRP